MITYAKEKGIEKKNYNLNYGKSSVLTELIKQHNISLSYFERSDLLDRKIETKINVKGGEDL